jgi:hypothetical protein
MKFGTIDEVIKPTLTVELGLDRLRYCIYPHTYICQLSWFLFPSPFCYARSHTTDARHFVGPTPEGPISHFQRFWLFCIFWFINIFSMLWQKILDNFLVVFEKFGKFNFMAKGPSWTCALLEGSNCSVERSFCGTSYWQKVLSYIPKGCTSDSYSAKRSYLISQCKKVACRELFCNKVLSKVALLCYCTAKSYFIPSGMPLIKRCESLDGSILWS